MKVITIDSEAYRTLVRKIDRIYDFVREQAEKSAPPAPDPTGEWVSNGEAAAMLGVSQRTMQRLRTGGGITYSIRGGKVSYTLPEVRRLMSGRIVASKYRQEENLLRAHQDYHGRKTAGKRKGKK